MGRHFLCKVLPVTSVRTNKPTDRQTDSLWLGLFGLRQIYPIYVWNETLNHIILFQLIWRNFQRGPSNFSPPSVPRSRRRMPGVHRNLKKCLFTNFPSIYVTDMYLRNYFLWPSVELRPTEWIFLNRIYILCKNYNLLSYNNLKKKINWFSGLMQLSNYII